MKRWRGGDGKRKRGGDVEMWRCGEEDKWVVGGEERARSASRAGVPDGGLVYVPKLKQLVQPDVTGGWFCVQAVGQKNEKGIFVPSLYIIERV